MLDPAIADSLRKRPFGRRAMTQRWINLTFVHFPLDPQIVQRTLPPGLTVDTFSDAEGNEAAWIGWVPFEIEDLALRGLRIPTASRFLETNVRTYVHREGSDPGVWFYSLDAASLLACKTARAWFGLPYWHARMSYEECENRKTYSGERLTGARPNYKVEVELGDLLPPSEPGSFEFFLVERYLLFSRSRRGLKTGRVHHSPYPLQTAVLSGFQDQLISTLGFEVGAPSSVLFSPGVSVDVFPLG